MQKQIASVYFAAVEARRPLYGGYYKIPAVPRGSEPFVLTIDDKIQISQEPSPDGKTRLQREYLIDGREIAACLLNEWTKESIGMTPVCKPGIWIVRNEVPILDEEGRPVVDANKRAMWRPSTDAERVAMWAEDLEAARAANANWAEYLIQAGDVFAEDPKQRRMISALMKTAARAFGRDRAWLQELKDSDTKTCPFCTKTIDSRAIKCQHCQEVVDVDRYAEMTARRDDAVNKVALKPPIAPPVRQPARA